MLLGPALRLAPGLALRAAVLAVSWLAALASPQSVAAHSELVRADPAPSSVVTEAPAEIRLTFAQPIDAGTAHVVVASSAGMATATGAPPIVLGAVAVLELPPLDPDTYSVTYQVVSPMDGHVTVGSFDIVVDPTASSPAPGTPLSTSSPSADLAVALARWVAVLAALVAAGVPIVWLIAARPALDAIGADASRPPWLIIGSAAAVSVGAIGAWLALAARPLVVLGHPGAAHATDGSMLDFAAPFGWTPFAVATRVALATAFATFGLAAWRSIVLDERRRRGRPNAASPATEARLVAVTVVLMVVALVALAQVGHAAAFGGPLLGVVDGIHLLAASVWIGGPVALARVAVSARPGARPRQRPRAAAAEAAGRTAPLALATLPLLAVTGLATTPVMIETPRDVVASATGDLLLAKALAASLAASAAVLTFAGLRFRRTVPLPAAIAAALVVTAVAALAGSVLATVEPASVAARRESAAPADRPVQLVGTAGPWRVHVSVSGSVVGPQSYSVTLSEADGVALAPDAAAVSITFGPPDGVAVPLREVGLARDPVPGRWTTQGAFASVAGEWRLGVTILEPGGRSHSTTLELPVDAAPALVPSTADTGIGVPWPVGLLWSLAPSGIGAWVLVAALLGLVVVLSVASLRSRLRRNRASAVIDVARVVSVLLATGVILGAGTRALVHAADTVPQDAAARSNPVASDLGAAARGERLYIANCATCHGSNGRGDGPSAGELALRPTDLRAAVADATDGELEYRIERGVAATPMPAFGHILTAADRWDVVAHLRREFGTGP